MSRRPPDADESTEGYLASVSDLMAGLIFIFVITLAVFALRLSEQTELQEQKVKELTSAKEVRKRILEDIKARLERADITVEIVPEQGILRLTEEGIHFPSGRSEPMKAHKHRVGELARVLGEVLPCFVEHPRSVSESSTNERPVYCSSRSPGPRSCSSGQEFARVETVLIEGHTDTQRVGSKVKFRDNLELSSMRAAEVFRMLVGCEPSLRKLQNGEQLEILSVSGYGATRLVDKDRPLHEQNRRIDLRFLMELPAAQEVKASTDEVEPAREVRERYEG